MSDSVRYDADPPRTVTTNSGLVLGVGEVAPGVEGDATHPATPAADHEQLRAKAERPSSGSWQVTVAATDGGALVLRHCAGQANATLVADCQSLADAEFIAAANPAMVIALLDEVVALHALIGAPDPDEYTRLIVENDALREAITGLLGFHFDPGAWEFARNRARHALAGGDQPDRNQP